MDRLSHYDRPCGYVLTDCVAEQFEQVDDCTCETLLVVNGAYQCTECGTVYGVVWGFNRFPRGRRPWRRAP